MRNIILKLLLASLIILVSSNGHAEELHQAVTDNNIESVKLVLENGADINQLGPSWYDYGSALHIAVQEGHQEIAQLLIEKGALVDLRDNSDLTPLHNAAWNGDLGMVKLLLDAGANITARDYSGATPLACAYSNNRTEIIQFIEAQLQSTNN